jgi:hypothetical protein
MGPKLIRTVRIYCRQVSFTMPNWLGQYYYSVGLILLQRRSSQNVRLKGQCHEIFCFRFFSCITFSQAPDNNIRIISNFFENLRRYSQVKVHHWCQRHRWQILPTVPLVLLTPVANLPPVSTIPAANLLPVSTTPVASCHRYQRHRRQICHRYQRYRRQICRRCQRRRWQIATGIHDTGDKFATGVIDTH